MKTMPQPVISAGSRAVAIAPGAPPVALEVSGLGKQYSKSGNVRPALRSVSVTIHRGEMVGLLGPNGAGKTTLLKILATLIEPDLGKISLFGRDLVADPIAARRHIGLVTCDERSFYWRLSGRHNLEFFAALYGVAKSAGRERITMLLETLDLADVGHRPYYSYSTGMRQKLAIARGLLAAPRFVLYDEPTRSLDPLSAQNIRRWITENRRRFPDTTHLLATNQLQEAEQLCQRVLILNRGEVIADDSIAVIRSRFQASQQMTHRIQYRGFGCSARLRPAPEAGLLEISEDRDENGATSTIRIRTAGDRGLSHVLSAVLESGAVIVRCETEQAPLEEVFCSLVKERNA